MYSPANCKCYIIIYYYKLNFYIISHLAHNVNIAWSNIQLPSLPFMNDRVKTIRLLYFIALN